MISFRIGNVRWYAGTFNRYHRLPNGKLDGTQRQLVVRFLPEYRGYRIPNVEDEDEAGFELETREYSAVLHNDEYRSPVLFMNFVNQWLPVFANEFAVYNLAKQGVTDQTSRIGWRRLSEHFCKKVIVETVEDLPETVEDFFEVELSAQELALIQERREEAARERRTRLDKNAAELKAEELLKEVLSAKEYEQFLSDGWINVVSATKKDVVYRIFPGTHAQIQVYDTKRSMETHSLCIEFRGYGMPQGDAIVMKYLMAKANENELWKVANVSAVRNQVRRRVVV